ncbi:MAG: flavin reductase family protein [Tabrizicola sp.]
MTAPRTLDPRALRNAFGAFATGVTVITTRQADGTPRGFTANSFTSVSLDPPLLLVCLARTAHSAEVFAKSPHFAVNILAADQKAVSGLFASRAPDKFAQCAWTPGPADMPLIDGALASFSCANHQLVDAGDHLILIGRIEAFATSEGQPLGYFRGSYFSIGIEKDLAQAAAAAKGSRLGAVLACDGGVLLRAEGDRLRLPLAPQATLDSLTAKLAALGLTSRIDFVYATFDDRSTGGHAVYYHGSVTGPLPQGYRILPLADLARAQISKPAEAAMLARYARDYRNGSFSIYHGTEATGQTRQIGALQERNPDVPPRTPQACDL